MGRPTEADLGIELTAEEQEVLSRPVQQSEDDHPISEDDDESLVQAKPAAETDEAKATRERDEAGKFVAKPKDDATPADAPKPDAPPVDDRKVDLRALQEARAENKLLMERMTTLLEASQRREAAKAEAEKPAPVIPDKNVDPLGYIDWLESRVGKIEGESKAQQEARQAQEAERAEMDQVLAVAVPDYQRAIAEDPTLEPTRNALMESYAREIAWVNRIPTDGTATPAQRQFLGNELTKLENGHIKFAVASGEPIGAYIRGLAASRGINASAAPAAVPAGQQPAPAALRPIAERQQAQQRHMSIGDLPGGAGPLTLNAKDIAKMSSTEFAALAKRLGDGGMDELFSKVQQA